MVLNVWIILLLDDNIFADRKSRYAKQAQEVYEELIYSIGGPDNVSEMQRQCAQRAAFMTLEIRKMEAQQAEEGTIDLDLYSKCVSAYRRLISALNNKSLRRVDIESPVADLRRYLEHTPTEALPTPQVQRRRAKTSR